MQLVVLDGHSLNPGDLSWELLENIAPSVIYPRTQRSLIVQRARNAQFIITNKVCIDDEIIQQLPKLKYIGVLATGVNNIDLDAAKKANITVCNAPGYSTHSVAQHVFSLIFEITNKLSQYIYSSQTWCDAPDFCYFNDSIQELNDLTLGLIGFGQISQQVATIAKAFGMNVLAYKPRPFQSELATFVDLNTLLSQSDIISLHCPLTPMTRHIINADSLKQMKPSAVLINTARGSLIDEFALANALNNDVIQAAGLDVLSQEPPTADNILLHAKNCYITPHIAWASTKSRQKLLQITCDNIHAFLNNKPQNVVV